MHVCNHFVLIATYWLDKEYLLDLVKVRDYLLEIDISLVGHDVRIVGVDSVKHKFLTLNDVAFRLLSHRHGYAIQEKNHLATT
jgi:hypothetical protein